MFAFGFLLSLALMPHNPNEFDIVWRMAVCGAGFGISQSPNNRAMITAAPKSRSGGASGMLGTARLLEPRLHGAALVALLFSDIPTNAAMVALLIGAFAALVAALVSLARLYEGRTLQEARPSNPEAGPMMHADVVEGTAEG